MKAKISNLGDVVVVNLSGRISMDYSQVFHKACLNDIGQRADKIIFNLKHLNFVGSSGIMPFVKTLSDLSCKKRLHFCQVGSEFQRIFSVSSLSHLKISSSEEQALAEIRGLDFLEAG